MSWLSPSNLITYIFLAFHFQTLLQNLVIFFMFFMISIRGMTMKWLITKRCKLYKVWRDYSSWTHGVELTREHLVIKLLILRHDQTLNPRSYRNNSLCGPPACREEHKVLCKLGSRRRQELWYANFWQHNLA